jgi:cytochrome c oxidase subunit 3
VSQRTLEDRPELADQFDDHDQQHDTANLGMWIFLATEVMFFGGLFTAYSVYRSLYWDAFVVASRRLSAGLGGINTAVLLTSSFTMALAVRAIQMRRRRELFLLLGATMILGAAFLGIKGYEWYDDYREHLVPGPNFEFKSDLRDQAQIFFLLYFIMTGLHGLHMIIGLCLVGTIAALSWKHERLGLGENQVEISGLYWHFVDLVWVFLYPLLYLVDRHQ